MVFVLDTDPGVDDSLALLLLLSEPRINHELRLITLSHGNCTLAATLNNLLSMFHVLDRERAFRTANSLPQFTDQKPAVHLGELGPLTGDANETSRTGENAVDVHGKDGLAGIHSSNPEFDAPQHWFEYFPEIPGNPLGKSKPVPKDKSLPFVPGQTPAWRAILDLLASEEPNTVTIIAVGPLTNLALAAQEDFATFSKVKQILSMGAAINSPGNITPVAEFNVFADPLAAAHIFALTSANPAITWPSSSALRTEDHTPLHLLLVPLDITLQHPMHLDEVRRIVGGTLKQYPGSVLAQWIDVWLTTSFENYGKIFDKGPENAVVTLHDPLTAMYALQGDQQWVVKTMDVRVETEGQWTTGMTVVDRRGREKREEEFRPVDHGKWITLGEGNSVDVLVDTPIKTSFSTTLLKRITKLPQKGWLW